MAKLPEQSKPGEVTQLLRECAGGRDAWDNLWLLEDNLAAPAVRQVDLN